jgi:hypothetical protein
LVSGGSLPSDTPSDTPGEHKGGFFMAYLIWLAIYSNVAIDFLPMMNYFIESEILNEKQLCNNKAIDTHFFN